MKFLSEDPIGFQSGDINHYRYVFNNPMIFFDPLGERWATYGTALIGGFALVSIYLTWKYGVPTLIEKAMPAEPKPEFPKPSCNPKFQSCEVVKPPANSCRIK